MLFSKKSQWMDYNGIVKNNHLTQKKIVNKGKKTAGANRKQMINLKPMILLITLKVNKGQIFSE